MTLTQFAIGLMLASFAALILCATLGRRRFSTAERYACFVLSGLALLTAGVWFIP